MGVFVPGGWQRDPIFEQDIRRMRPPTFKAQDRRISEMYGGRSLRVLLYIERPLFPDPEVMISFKVVRISRRACERRKGAEMCEGLGEVYPTFTPIPESAKRRQRKRRAGGGRR